LAKEAFNLIQILNNSSVIELVFELPGNIGLSISVGYVGDIARE